MKNPGGYNNIINDVIMQIQYEIKNGTVLDIGSLAIAGWELSRRISHMIDADQVCNGADTIHRSQTKW